MSAESSQRAGRAGTRLRVDPDGISTDPVAMVVIEVYRMDEGAPGEWITRLEVVGGEAGEAPEPDDLLAIARMVLNGRAS